MSFCTNCGSRIDGNQKFCTNCGAPLEPVELPAVEAALDAADGVAQAQPKPEQQPYSQPSYQSTAQQPYQQPQPAQQQYQQPGQQQSYQQPGQQQYQQPQQDSFIPDAQEFREAIDSGSIWWGVLGLIIPLVGIILFFVWRNTKPQSAKMAGIGAAIGIVAGLVMQMMF